MEEVTLSCLNVDLLSVARLSDVIALKPAGVVSRLAKGACQGPLSPAGLICCWEMLS